MSVKGRPEDECGSARREPTPGSEPASFAAATDVLQGDFAPAAAPRDGRRWPAWRGAVALGLPALVSRTASETRARFGRSAS